MADWVARIYEKEKVAGPFSGGGFWAARVWPANVSDSTAPVISNITPAPGSNISPNQIVQFDVTDNIAFRRIVITALYPNGLHEVIHNGDAFTANYAVGSGRTNLVGGYRYTVIRNGGWTIGNNPTLLAYAIDTAGNEAP